MATKKELEDRIAVLEAQIALLRAQRPINVLPRPSDTPWPAPYQPYWAVQPAYPYQVWCGANTSVGAKGTFTVNASAA